MTKAPDKAKILIAALGGSKINLNKSKESSCKMGIYIRTEDERMKRVIYARIIVVWPKQVSHFGAIDWNQWIL